MAVAWREKRTVSNYTSGSVEIGGKENEIRGAGGGAPMAAARLLSAHESLPFPSGRNKERSFPEKSPTAFDT